MELKSLSLFDLEQTRKWRNEQLPILRTSFPLTFEMQVDFYKNVICNRQANARYWGIHSDDRLIGMCGLENIQWENRLAEISFILNPECSVKEYGDGALKLLLHEGFNNMNLENIYTEVYDCHPGISFWANIIEKHNCEYSFLPNRKYYNGKYHSSLYINFNKGEYLEHENTIIKST
jgi:hypothetical protein